MHFSRLASSLLKDEESAQDNHVSAGNFAKYSPILIFFTLRLSNTQTQKQRATVAVIGRIHAVHAVPD